MKKTDTVEQKIIDLIEHIKYMDKCIRIFTVGIEELSKYDSNLANNIMIAVRELQAEEKKRLEVPHDYKIEPNRFNMESEMKELINAITCTRNQLNIAHKAIEELYHYDSKSALQYAKAISKVWEDFIKTSIYREQMEKYELNKLFGINKDEE